jgi:hypothetical protein
MAVVAKLQVFKLPETLIEKAIQFNSALKNLP